MKLNAVKANSKGNNTTAAFTLIEMIGVLAVIAILAALLIPKVFNAINSARINNTAVSIDTMKTAVTDHYGKYGSFNMQNGTTVITIPTNGYDLVLMTEGLLDKPFAVKIGGGGLVQLVSTGGNVNAGYQLDGTTNTLTTSQAFTAECVITNVLPQDALDLNTLIDGTNLSTPGNVIGGTTPDTSGRVEYGVAGANGSSAGLLTVSIYLTGR